MFHHQWDPWWNHLNSTDVGWWMYWCNAIQWYWREISKMKTNKPSCQHLSSTKMLPVLPKGMILPNLDPFGFRNITLLPRPKLIGPSSGHPGSAVRWFMYSCGCWGQSSVVPARPMNARDFAQRNCWWFRIPARKPPGMVLKPCE